MCEENVNDLLKWVTTVEQKISSVGGPREKIDELRNQINALKVGTIDLYTCSNIENNIFLV